MPTTTQWLQSHHAKQFLHQEAMVLRDCMTQIHGPSVLLSGNVVETDFLNSLDFPLFMRQSFGLQRNDESSNDTSLHKDFFADSAFLPLDFDSVATVFLLHVLEQSQLPHQVLREAHRVLQPEGQIVLTGFNPYSLFKLQGMLNKSARFNGNYFSVARIKDWLNLLGFEITYSKMYQYAPTASNKKLRHALRHIETIGDRWLPMMGGGYMIMARKKQAGSMLLGLNKKKQKLGRVRQPAIVKAGLKMGTKTR